MESPGQTPEWWRIPADTPLYGVSGITSALSARNTAQKGSGGSLSGLFREVGNFLVRRFWENNTVNTGNPVTVCKRGNKLPVLSAPETPG